MILGIDATNISTGGGLNHLVHILRNADPRKAGFSKVVIWGPVKTLGKLDDAPWLEKHSTRLLNSNLAARSLWKLFYLRNALIACGCDVLFSPGGSYTGSFHPFVTMSRNMLPFEWREARRFGFSLFTLKLLVLRLVQSVTCRRADGIIFLTDYARETVLRIAGNTHARVVTIPHGVDRAFSHSPDENKLMKGESGEKNSSFRVIYVSIIDMYKHQWHVLRAISELRDEGLNVSVEFVGPANPGAKKIFDRYRQRFDPGMLFTRYAGNIANESMPGKYREADICLFASTCENMPNILLEGMAAGLPIACSSKLPMPEILKDAGIYFDPENVNEIKDALRQLLESGPARVRLANKSWRLAQKYSWRETSEQTFRFVSDVARLNNDKATA